MYTIYYKIQMSRNNSVIVTYRSVNVISVWGSFVDSAGASFSHEVNFQVHFQPAKRPEMNSLVSKLGGNCTIVSKVR